MGYNISYNPIIVRDQTKSSSHPAGTTPEKWEQPSLPDVMRAKTALKSQPRYAKDGLGSDPTRS